MINNFLFILATLFLCKTYNNNISCNNSVNITFKIINEHNKCVSGAVINIIAYNSNQVLNLATSCNGLASLTAAYRNVYKVVIYKQGYKKKTFFVNPYKNINCNICLCYCIQNRLYGFITNQNNEVINKAIVVLYKVIKKKLYLPVRFTYTDFTGEYNFINIPKGMYIVKAIK